MPLSTRLMPSTMYCVRCDKQHSIYIPCLQGDRKWPKYEDVVYVGIDPAKPGEDRMVIMKSRQCGLTARINEAQSFLLKDLPDDSKVVSPPAAPSFDVDHAWDMLVLAARTSRYCE